jgi:hypothetical protein
MAVRGEAMAPNPPNPPGGSAMNQQFYPWSPLLLDYHQRLVTAETQRQLNGAKRAGPHMQRSRLPLWLTSIATVLVVLIALGASAQGQVQVSTSSVLRFADFGTVEGARSTLVHGDGFVAATLTTSGLTADAPYTLWWVVFNQPEGCLGACDLDDLFFPDGTMNVNPAADIAILFADGTITDELGNAAFSAVLHEGQPLGEVVLGAGLRDAAYTEVPLVVRAHGPLDPERALQQLTTFEPHPTIGGDCVACYDEQFAIHLAAMPATALR